MVFSRFSKFTTSMIYGGTFCLSVLSFFTTFYGLTIILDKYLALVGSLGLQIAMLGIAWNLMKIRENRSSYVAVFTITAIFSIFFSFANFDTSLKANMRASEARMDYTEQTRPILNSYVLTARKATLKGEYQLERLNTLIKMEEEKGWATLIDEGSHDEFIQSIINGARFMVDSWKNNQGADYRQGRGRGIIADYLVNRRQEVANYYQLTKTYVELADSISLAFSSELPVNDQYRMANLAWVQFPLNAVNYLSSAEIAISHPPDKLGFMEQPKTRQQAFMLVIADLFAFDRIAIFSILLAIAIDLVVILVALAGSYAFDDEEHLFNRVRKDSARRVKRMKNGNSEEFAGVLGKNIEQFEQATDYGLKLNKVMKDYRTKKKNYKMVVDRSGENATEELPQKIKNKFKIPMMRKVESLNIKEYDSKPIEDKSNRRKIVI